MRRRIAIGLVASAGVGLFLAGLWLTRPVAITYRADAGACRYRATYSEPGGRRRHEARTQPLALSVTLRHGEVANLVVIPEPGCASDAHCAIVEDGAEVSESRGRHGASCSAATGR